ncbi:hypothetical protein FACS1894181_11110 [Bacteroidia bacterium]|nr:hypothetical protein FACS1894181_11110 [Bacteroidia bacterium]
MDQIGVVWSKTYGPGAINNLKPILTVAGGGYVAAGRAWNSATPAGIGRCEGLIIEINESGDTIRTAKARIPQGYINTHSDLSAANASFDFAFKTNDDGYLAFGVLQDQNAPEDEREYNYETATPKGGPHLTNGIWIVKFNSQGQVVSNTMERGRFLANGWQMLDGNFLVGGWDAAEPAGSNSPSLLTLLRKYDQSGGIITDKREEYRGYREIRSIYQYSGTDNYLASTPDRILRINSSLDITSTMISSMFLQDVTNPYANSITPSLDGGFFVNTYLNANSNAAINYDNGVGIYKVDNANNSVYYKIDQPADTLFIAPLLLPGGAVPAKYIGAMRSIPDGINYSPYYMYELTDDGNFTFRVGDLYPDGTTLRIVGQEDGFFSSGTSAAGHAAIAKLSTCANFILNVGSTEEQLLVDDASMAAFAGRNITWSGNIGTVTYKWDLRDITPDGIAVVDLGTISGTNTVIPAKQFTLVPGKESAVLQYTITAIDSYKNNGIDQTCQQTENIIVKINKYPDLATVQKYYSVEIPVLANDSLPASLLSGISIKDSVTAQPKAGILNGAGQRLIYTNTGKPLANNIDSFLYKITFQDPRTSTLRTFSTWVYIYVLDDKNGAAGCYLQPYTVKLSAEPAGTTFDWYNKTGGAPLSPLSGSTRVVASITADATFLIQPKVPDPWYTRWEDFPKGDFTIKLANPGNTTTTMRWTGLTDSLWQNPANWVALKSDANGKPYEAPASFAPTTCVNVIIPSAVDYFPELVDSAYCNDILMKDRAMLKNPHVLVYRNASVEIKLKPSERDRFVMWSAPLRNMYSGDYHYRVGDDPYWGDVFMNYFQEANPDYPATGQATIHHFTATTGTVTEPLELGRAFNVKVATTTVTRDSLLRFPRKDPTYKYNGITTTMARAAESKFITHGTSGGVFDMWVSGAKLPGVSLVQVVNPYLAYLDFSKFAALTANDLSGYYIWSGDPNDGFATIVSLDKGNRIVTSAPSYSPDPTWIPPLQSFFVQPTWTIKTSGQVKMSADWTTVRPPSPTYSLRASKKTVSSGGVLHITLSQGQKKAYAALLYNPSASNFTDPEDMPAIIYEDLPLTVYTFSMNEALAINSSSTFDMFNVPIGFRATTAGETKLEFTNQETFGYEVTLIDKTLNKRIDLSATPEYTFTVTKTSSAPVEINDRFSLEMKYTGNGVTITGNEAAQPTALQVSAGAGYIYIKSESGVISRLQIYDTVGRLVYGTANLNERQFKLPVNGKQMYIVKATIGEETVVEKIMAN